MNFYEFFLIFNTSSFKCESVAQVLTYGEGNSRKDATYVVDMLHTGLPTLLIFSDLSVLNFTLYLHIELRSINNNKEFSNNIRFRTSTSGSYCCSMFID